MNKQSADSNEFNDFETQLRQLVPVNAEALHEREAELMYRCGWEAALAAGPVRAEFALSPPASTASRWAHFNWRTFAGGTATGMAASLLFICLALSSASVSDDSPAIVAKSANQNSVSAAGAIQVANGREPRPERPTTTDDSDIDPSRLFAQLLPWSPPSAPAAYEMLFVSRKVLPSQVLSPAAYRNWSEVLRDGGQMNSDVLHSQQPSKSVRDMLSELIEPNDFF